MLPFADNYLAGSLLTLLLPVAVLIAIAVWYVISVRRIPGGEPGPVAPVGEPGPVAPVGEQPPGSDE
ncbi:MAG: hypothetical protein ACYDHH_14330 [Solirubrobacteraceae bacterium]